MRPSLDQPPPRPNAGEEVWPEVIAEAERALLPPEVLADMRDRDQLGRERYGVPLRRGDGRDHLVDAYAEALDLCAYLGSATGAGSILSERARNFARDIRRMLAPCGGCAALRTVGSESCSSCGATCGCAP